MEGSEKIDNDSNDWMPNKEECMPSDIVTVMNNDDDDGSVDSVQLMADIIEYLNDDEPELPTKLGEMDGDNKEMIDSGAKVSDEKDPGLTSDAGSKQVRIADNDYKDIIKHQPVVCLTKMNATDANTLHKSVDAQHSKTDERIIEAECTKPSKSSEVKKSAWYDDDEDVGSLSELSVSDFSLSDSEEAPSVSVKNTAKLPSSKTAKTTETINKKCDKKDGKRRLSMSDSKSNARLKDFKTKSSAQNKNTHSSTIKSVKPIENKKESSGKGHQNPQLKERKAETKLKDNGYKENSKKNDSRKELSSFQNKNWRYELTLSNFSFLELNDESFRKFINLASDCAFDFSHLNKQHQGIVKLFFGDLATMQSGMQKLCQVSFTSTNKIKGHITGRLMKPSNSTTDSSRKWKASSKVELSFVLHTAWTDKLKQLVQGKDWKKRDDSQQKIAKIQRLPSVVEKDILSLLFPFSIDIHSQPFQNSDKWSKFSYSSIDVEFPSENLMKTVLCCLQEFHLTMPEASVSSYKIFLSNFKPSSLPPGCKDTAANAIPKLTSLQDEGNRQGRLFPSKSNSHSSGQSRPSSHSHSHGTSQKGTKSAKLSEPPSSYDKVSRDRKRPSAFAEEKVLPSGKKSRWNLPEEKENSHTVNSQNLSQTKEATLITDANADAVRKIAQAQGLDANNSDVLCILELQRQLASMQSANTSSKTSAVGGGDGLLPTPAKPVKPILKSGNPLREEPERKFSNVQQSSRFDDDETMMTTGFRNTDNNRGNRGGRSFANNRSGQNHEPEGKFKAPINVVDRNKKEETSGRRHNRFSVESANNNQKNVSESNFYPKEKEYDYGDVSVRQQYRHAKEDNSFEKHDSDPGRDWYAEGLVNVSRENEYGTLAGGGNMQKWDRERGYAADRGRYEGEEEVSWQREAGQGYAEEGQAAEWWEEEEEGGEPAAPGYDWNDSRGQYGNTMRGRRGGGGGLIGRGGGLIGRGRGGELGRGRGGGLTGRGRGVEPGRGRGGGLTGRGSVELGRGRGGGLTGRGRGVELGRGRGGGLTDRGGKPERGRGSGSEMGTREEFGRGGLSRADTGRGRGGGAFGETERERKEEFSRGGGLGRVSMEKTGTENRGREFGRGREGSRGEFERGSAEKTEREGRGGSRERLEESRGREKFQRFETEAEKERGKFGRTGGDLGRATGIEMGGEVMERRGAEGRGGFTSRGGRAGAYSFGRGGLSGFGGEGGTDSFEKGVGGGFGRGKEGGSGGFGEGGRGFGRGKRGGIVGFGGGKREESGGFGAGDDVSFGKGGEISGFGEGGCEFGRGGKRESGGFGGGRGFGRGRGGGDVSGFGRGKGEIGGFGGGRGGEDVSGFGRGKGEIGGFGGGRGFGRGRGGKREETGGFEGKGGEAGDFSFRGRGSGFMGGSRGGRGGGGGNKEGSFTSAVSISTSDASGGYGYGRGVNESKLAHEGSFGKQGGSGSYSNAVSHNKPGLLGVAPPPSSMASTGGGSGVSGSGGGGTTGTGSGNQYEYDYNSTSGAGGAASKAWKCKGGGDSYTSGGSGSRNWNATGSGGGGSNTNAWHDWEEGGSTSGGNYTGAHDNTSSNWDWNSGGVGGGDNEWGSYGGGGTTTGSASGAWNWNRRGGKANTTYTDKNTYNSGGSGYGYDHNMTSGVNFY